MTTLPHHSVIMTLFLLSTVPTPTLVVNITRGDTVSSSSGSEPPSPPPPPPGGQTFDMLLAGSSIKLTCDIAVAEAVNTSIILLVNWTKDGVPVADSGYLTVTPLLQTDTNKYHSELTFPLLSTTRDSAVYSCNVLINSTSQFPYVSSSDKETESITLNVTGIGIVYSVLLTHHYCGPSIFTTQILSLSYKLLQMKLSVWRRAVLTLRTIATSA